MQSTNQNRIIGRTGRHQSRMWITIFGGFDTIGCCLHVGQRRLQQVIARNCYTQQSEWYIIFYRFQLHISGNDRLGHGSVDHVRRPKKVSALQGKKIVSIATGSLHCVACTDTGEVFTWGDNDEVRQLIYSSIKF